MMLLLRDAACAAAFCVLSVSSAVALTAEEVWTDWQRVAGERQPPVTATAQRQGDRLILTDVTFPFGTAITDPDQLMVERIELQELPDGRVSVLLPERFPVTFVHGNPGSPAPDVVTLMASAPDFSMIIADIGEKAAFEVTAPSLVLSLDEVAPALGVDETVDVNVAIADLSVRHRMDLTRPTQTVASTIGIGTAHFDLLVDVDNPEQPKVDMSVDIAALSWVLDTVVPPSVLQRPLEPKAEIDNPLLQVLKGLADGLTVKAELTYGPIAMRADVSDADDSFQFDVTSASGRGLARIDAAAAAYDIAVGKTVFSINGAPPGQQPLNFTTSVAELGYGLSVGIGDLVTPQEARLSLRMVDLALPAEALAQVDPAGALGSSPLTFVLDLAGRYALGPAMLKPEWEPVPGTFPPIDIVDVTLADLAMSGFGVNVAGGGSLAFDETDLATFDGLPAPDGKVSFQATGINALIDRAVAAGLIPESELTGLRLGLAFIAKPGAEPGSLQTEVEFRDKGLYLNGQQLR